MKAGFIRHLLFFICVIGFTCAATAQQPQKQLSASRTKEPIVIDGKLSESYWDKAGIATDFIQNSLYPGEKSTQKSEVRVLYDDNAIYIGAMLYDNKDSIFRQLTPRDDFGDGNTDVFAVSFDTYSDKQNGFSVRCLRD